MNASSSEHPPDPAGGPPVGSPDAAPPVAPTLPHRVSIDTAPSLPHRVSIHTAPTPPSATPSAPGQWLLDQPYGASANAPYAVAAAPRRHRIRRVLLPLLVIAVLAGGAAVVFKDQLFGDDPPTHPSVWDPQVVDIAEFVGVERSLDWLHPVYVDFVPEAEFVALFDQPAVTANEAVDDLARRYSALYDAFGLAVGYDITQGESTVSAVTTLGFYSPETDRVTVRGDTLTPAVTVVLAHELTHALQAQHFDLPMGGPDDLARRAVVEADALRVEAAYRATLSVAEQQAADDGNTLALGAEEELDDVPWAVVERRYAPYVLGPILVDAVFATDGNEGVDRLIRTPPSEEVLLNPWLLDAEPPNAEVTVEVPDGAQVLDEPQPLSAVDILVMLDAWLPWRQARSALDGWAGGAFTSYEQDGTVCFTATATFDESGDRFAVAVSAWAAAAGSTAAPTVVVNDVTFEACARGISATAPPEPVVSPLEALLLENQAIDLAGPDPLLAEIQRYQCFAGTMIDDPLLAPLLQADALSTDEEAVFRWQSTIAANECGVPPLTL